MRKKKKRPLGLAQISAHKTESHISPCRSLETEGAHYIVFSVHQLSAGTTLRDDPTAAVSDVGALGPQEAKGHSSSQ